PRISTATEPGCAIPQQSPQNRPGSRPPPNPGAQYRNSHRKTAPDPPQRPAVGSLSPRPCRVRRPEEGDARNTVNNNSLSTHSGAQPGRRHGGANAGTGHLGSEQILRDASRAH